MTAFMVSTWPVRIPDAKEYQAMTRYHKALGMFLVTVFGLWGCARGPVSGTGTAGNDKTKTLETKLARAEDDLRTTANSRDEARRKIQEAEETMTLLHQEIDRLHLVARERDELKGDLKSRTVERDQIQAQYDTFRRTIKDLLGQAETSLKTGKPIAGLASFQGPPIAPAGDGGN